MILVLWHSGACKSAIYVKVRRGLTTGETSLVEAPTSESFLAVIASASSLVIEKPASLTGIFDRVSCFHVERDELVTETASGALDGNN